MNTPSSRSPRLGRKKRGGLSQEPGAPASPGAWYKPALERRNLMAYFVLLALAILGLIFSIGDRDGDQLWGYFPLFLSATLYSAWMMFSALAARATPPDTRARLGYSALIAPFVMSIPISIVYVIVYFAADLSRFRDRHYFHGEGLANVFLSPMMSLLTGGIAALGVLIVFVLPGQRAQRSPRGQRAQRPKRQKADAPAPLPTPGLPTWPQAFRSLFRWPNLIAFLAFFALAATATYINAPDPWSAWGIIGYPFPAMLFSMWLVLEAIWRATDRVKVGKRVTLAMFVVPLVFTLLQLGVAALAAHTHPDARRGMTLDRYLPIGSAPGIFVFIGVLFAAALALATWIISGTTTALLRGWARRYPIAQSQPRLIRFSTAMIGVGLTPFAAGWLVHYWLERGFGITWRMLQSVIGSSAPDVMPFLIMWFTIIALLYGGGALIVGGLLLGVLAIRRRYVAATSPVVPVPIPASAEAAVPQVPANYVEPAPGQAPHPDSPLAEYLEQVQYDGPAAREEP